MKTFEHWPTLSKHLQNGSFSFIDLAFAKSVLKKINSQNEAHAALLAALFAFSREGHLMLDLEENALNESLKRVLCKESDALADLIRQGTASFPAQGLAVNAQKRSNAWVHQEGSCYYLQKNWVYESEILKSLQKLRKALLQIPLTISEINPILNEAQKNAIELGLKHSLTFLTGGPGTGKTFTAVEFVKACLSALPSKRQEPFRIILTAPTGKAVAQLESNLRRSLGEVPHLCTGTLHALLKVKMHAYEEEEAPLLLADLIIIDECSMIDVKVFSRLFSALPEGARVLLIGDQDQLPPVEAGSVFTDLLDSDICPATHLTQCLRSDRKAILDLASLIKEGNTQSALQHLSSNASPDIQWIDLKEAHVPFFWERCKKRFPSYFSEKPDPGQILKELGRFSLLSCVRQGPLGVDALNDYFLRQYFSVALENAWWVMPIMIVRNDDEMQLYNGDLGFLVRQITPHFSLRQFSIEDYALFSDRKGGYRHIAALGLPAFEYSYCLSVHKSQGSEYDEVFILFPPGSEQFGREVLYTAITRARFKIELAAQSEILVQAISHRSRKISGLSRRFNTIRKK